MGQISLESSTRVGRSSRGSSREGAWGPRTVVVVVLVLFALVFTMFQYYSSETILESADSFIWKSSLNITPAKNNPKFQSWLVSCDDLDTTRQRGQVDAGTDDDGVVATIRNWPRDQAFNVPSHCIYGVEGYLVPISQCQCRNPTVAVPRTSDFWQKAFQRNQKLAKKAAAMVSLEGHDLDVVLLGDSITEHWIGEAGARKHAGYEENAKAFQQVLTRKGGGLVDALALGIAADQIPNLLFRLQVARYGQYLQPKVWWILIGSNDMAMAWCNVEAVLAGNIAVIEEIRETQPGAVVVINSILPRLPEPLLGHIDELNQRLRDYACGTKDVYFFDATSIFRDEATGQVRHLPDGVHPDGPSSWTWAREIAKAVEELTGGTR